MLEGFSIKQISQKTGLTEDAIRYYEKIGLLPPIKRKANGHRFYDSGDIEIMELITCLKKTGMPLEEMKVYIQLPYKENMSAVPELKATLQEYRRKISTQISDLQRILQFIDFKLDHDQSLLKDENTKSLQ